MIASLRLIYIIIKLAYILDIANKFPNGRFNLDEMLTDRLTIVREEG